jgi:transposase InsO family protein
MDFMSDALANGEKLRVLAVVDAFTRECLALEAGCHFRGQDVGHVLTTIAATRGRPNSIQCDNGTEFTSRALDHWAWTATLRPPRSPVLPRARGERSDTEGSRQLPALSGLRSIAEPRRSESR